jgi:capsular polysaccharide biosynthesis protein
MIAIGLMVRERAQLSPRSSSPSLESMWARVRRSARLIMVLSVLGGLLGAVVAWSWTPMYEATAPVLLAPSPLYLDLSSDEGPKEITIDTEASMVFSEQAIGRVRGELGLPESPDVRDSIRVTAPPNSRVLEITVRDDDPARAAAIADAVAVAYLEVRNDYLAQRRDQVREQIEQQLSSVAGRGMVVTPGGAEDDGSGIGSTQVLAEDELRAALTSLSLVSTDAGTVLRPAVAQPARKQAEVPIVSGALLGALAGLGIMSWHEAGRSSRQGRRRPATSERRERSRAEA